MKKNIVSLIFLLLITLGCFILIGNGVVFSQTGIENEKIKKLKEKVANKVAELRQSKTFVLSGKVKSKNAECFILISEDGDKKILISKDTKYYWINGTGKKLNINYSNLEAGDDFAVLAFGFPEDDLTAKIAIGKLNNFSITGKIKEEPASNKITINLSDKSASIPIAIQAATEIFSLNNDGETLRAKKSDLTIGTKALIRVYRNEEKDNEIIAKRILIL